VTQLTHLALDADEMAILIDALEADLADCVEAAQEANDDGEVVQASGFATAAQRVEAVLQKVRRAGSD
jgi:hypothetical protein